MNNKLIILVMLSLLSLSAYGQIKQVVRNLTCEMCKVAKSISDFSGESNTCIACAKKQAAVQRRKEQQAAERRHQQQLEQERVARERAEKERIANEQAEKGRIAREKEEKERLARIKAEEACPYVDLGLPSGTLWAKCNVGASKPEEYGDYFAWGETKGYKCGTMTFNWDSYKWGSVATFVPKKKKYQREEIQEVKKYCMQYWGTPDGKSVLDLEDDAAYVNLGNNWCMPSNEQFEEAMHLVMVYS